MQYTYQVIFLALVVYTIFTITVFDDCAPKIIPKTALGAYDVAVVNVTCWFANVENTEVSWFKANPVISDIECVWLLAALSLFFNFYKYPSNMHSYSLSNPA